MVGLAATIYYNGINDLRVKLLAMICFAILFVFALFKKRPTNNIKVIKEWFGWFALTVVINTFYGLSPVDFSVSLPLIVAYSTYKIGAINMESVNKFMLPFCIFSSFAALYSIIHGLGGFELTDFDDNELVKNQIGATFATIAILCAVYSLNNRSIRQMLYGLCSILNIYPAIFFGCRTAMLCYALCLLFLVYAKYKVKGLLMIPVFIIAAAAFGGEELRELLYNSIVGERDVGDFDNLSSGRLTQAILSIEYFVRHPLFGFYGSGDSYAMMPPNAHMYILFRLTKWGLIGSVPYIMLYISVFRIFISSIKDKAFSLAGMLMVAILESFSEYYPPFGPGSCFIIVFAFMGIYLRDCKLK